MLNSSFWPACLLRNAFCLSQTPSCRIFFKGTFPVVIPSRRYSRWGDIYLPPWGCSNFSGLVGTMSQLKKQKKAARDLCVLLKGSGDDRFLLGIYDYVSRYLVKLVYHSVILLPQSHFPCPSWFRVTATHWQHGMPPPFWKLVSPLISVIESIEWQIN